MYIVSLSTLDVVTFMAQLNSIMEKMNGILAYVVNTNTQDCWQVYLMTLDGGCLMTPILHQHFADGQ